MATSAGSLLAPRGSTARHAGAYMSSVSSTQAKALHPLPSAFSLLCASSRKPVRACFSLPRCSPARCSLEMPGVSSYAPISPRLELDPAAVLFQQRMVFLGSQVDDLSADWVISQLLLLDAQDPSKDITLVINSPGGSVTAGMGIYDAMKLCRADVSTLCFGLAASMGAFLLAAGAPGKRLCMPNARVMIHQPLGGAQGAATDVSITIREMMYHKIKLNKILARVSGQTEDKIEEDTDRDNFMSAWEAKEYGLVDHVVGEDRMSELIAPVGELREPAKTKVWDLWTVKQGKERRRLPGEQNLLLPASVE